MGDPRIDHDGLRVDAGRLGGGDPLVQEGGNLGPHPPVQARLLATDERRRRGVHYHQPGAGAGAQPGDGGVAEA